MDEGDASVERVVALMRDFGSAYYKRVIEFNPLEGKHSSDDNDNNASNSNGKALVEAAAETRRCWESSSPASPGRHARGCVYF